MCLTEYNEEETMQMFEEEGRRKGRKEATLETILSFVRDGFVPLAVGAQRAGMDEAEFAKLLKS